MFAPNNRGVYHQKLNGQLVPISKRDIKDHIVEFSYKFNIKIFKNPQHYPIFFKFTGKYSPTRIQLNLHSPQDYLKKEGYLKTIQSIFQGALLIILLYNIVLYSIVRDRTYLYYSAYILTYSIYYLSYYGLLPANPELSIYISAVCVQSTMFFYFLFMKLFVHAEQLFPRWNRLINYWIKIKSGMVLLALGLMYSRLYLQEIEPLLLLLFLIDGLLLLVTCYKLLISGNIIARYFVLGSFILVF